MLKNLRIVLLPLLALLYSGQTVCAQNTCDQLRQDVYQFAQQARGDLGFIEELNRRSALADACDHNGPNLSELEQATPKPQENATASALRWLGDQYRSLAGLIGNQKLSQSLANQPVDIKLPPGFFDPFETPNKPENNAFTRFNQPSTSYQPSPEAAQPGFNPFTQQVNPALKQQRTLTAPQPSAGLPATPQPDAPQSACNQYWCGSTSTFQKN